jgi:hypothetical protein
MSKTTSRRRTTAATATATAAATTTATTTACPREACTEGTRCYEKKSCKTTKQLQEIAGSLDRSKIGLYKRGHHTRCGDGAVVSTQMRFACPNGLYLRDYVNYKEACKQADDKIKKCDGSDSKRNAAEGLKNECVSLRRKFRDNLYKPVPIADRGSYVGHQYAIGVIETQFRNSCTGSRSRKKSSVRASGKKQKRRSKKKL